jgi:hypothetical protein
LNRELRFVQLNIDSNFLKLMIFIDASFANVDFHSQIEYVICLIDEQKANLIHWSFTKCKRIIKSVLTIELYAMINDFDVESIIKSTLKKIINVFISLILCTNFKSLYDCLIKLETIIEKRLMIDLMCLRQSFERRKIMKIQWIDDNSNSANVMIKSKSCSILSKLIDSNTIDLKIIEWVERVEERTN